MILASKQLGSLGKKETNKTPINYSFSLLVSRYKLFFALSWGRLPVVTCLTNHLPDHWRVGGTESNENMAASLDDDFEFNNQDYYSLLNVRKEVGCFRRFARKPSGCGLFPSLLSTLPLGRWSAIGASAVSVSPFIIIRGGWNRLM